MISILCTRSMLTGSLYGSFSDQGNGISPGAAFWMSVLVPSGGCSVAAAARTRMTLLRLGLQNSVCNVRVTGNEGTAAVDHPWSSILLTWLLPSSCCEALCCCC